MRVELMYCTMMMINFDRILETSPKPFKLGEALDFARQMIADHDFNQAEIIDANTGEILAILNR